MGQRQSHWELLRLLSIGGKVGVNLFVMLSAWFLTSETTLRKEKLAKLWAQIFFYSVVIYGFACVSGLTQWTLADQVKALLPVLSKQWWFASSYVFLYLLCPWLNRRLARLSRKQHFRLVLILAVFWFAVPVFTWLPEHDIITRSVIVKNKGRERVLLEKVVSASLDIVAGDFDLITFGGRYAMERNVSRAHLEQGSIIIGSRRGYSSHQFNPMMILADHNTTEDFGKCYAMSFVYSGAWKGKAEKDHVELTRM